MQKACNAREITIDSDYCDNPKEDRDDCRLDCMKGCQVIEIKPKSQISLGRTQAAAYHRGLLTMFSKLGMKMFDERGMAYFRSCLTSDQTSLALTFEVEPYDFCEGMTDPRTLTTPVPEVEIEMGD